MDVDQILDRLLYQHASLRRLIARCDVCIGASRWEALDDLRLALAAHQRCEERLLRRLLPPTAIEQMHVEHLGERIALETQDDARLDAALAGLRAHLDDEERKFLNERTLDIASRSSCTAN